MTELQQKIKSMVEDFSKGREVWKQANEIAEMIVKDHFGYSGNRMLGTHVEIEKILTDFGLSSLETVLNHDIGFCLDQLDARSYRTTTIMLENKLGELRGRVCLANILAKYLINEFIGKEPELGISRVLNNNASFPKNRDSLLSEILATYILMPPGLVMNFLEKYENKLRLKNIYPMDSHEMLRQLGQALEIDTFTVLKNWNYLRFYFCGEYLSGNIPERYYKYFEK